VLCNTLAYRFLSSKENVGVVNTIPDPVWKIQK